MTEPSEVQVAFTAARQQAERLSAHLARDVARALIERGEEVQALGACRVLVALEAVVGGADHAVALDKAMNPVRLAP